MSDNNQSKAAPLQRRTIFIKKSLQFKYISIIFASALLAFVIAVHEVVFTMNKAAEANPAVQAVIQDVYAMTPVFLFKSALFLGIVLIIAIIISHRLAGPLYKFEKSCAIVGDGDLTYRVYLRKGDQLTDMQREFNNMVYALQNVTSEYENFRSYAAGSEDEKVRERALEAEVRIKKLMPELKY